MRRRQFLSTLGALPFLPRAALASPPAQRLAAAWQHDNAQYVGILEAADTLTVQSALQVPTRAHGLYAEADGALLTVARRPGNWLLRFNVPGQVPQWRWSEPGRAFTGHVISDGARVYSTETDLDSGDGLIGVRHARSLEKIAEWRTGGIDPHELILDATRPGHLIVANGGVPTRPETGRQKHDLARMDSSLTRIDTARGEIRARWKLDDPRLSLRHLAWNGRGRDAVLGIALQAEHDSPEAKATAPVLAVLSEERLRTVNAPRSMAGYGGSIIALGAGFAISSPRAHGVALFGAHGFETFIALEDACPLAVSEHGLLAGGGKAALLGGDTHAMPGIRLDNHWTALSSG